MRGDAEQEQSGQDGNQGEHQGQAAGEAGAQHVVAVVPQQQPAVAEQHGEQDGDNQAACGNQPPEIFGQRAAAVGGEGEAVNQCGSECDEEY